MKISSPLNNKHALDQTANCFSGDSICVGSNRWRMTVHSMQVIFDSSPMWTVGNRKGFGVAPLTTSCDLLPFQPAVLWDRNLVFRFRVDR